jgi:hypothetical protein
MMARRSFRTKIIVAFDSPETAIPNEISLITF